MTYTIKPEGWIWRISEDLEHDQFVLDFRKPPVSGIAWERATCRDTAEECASALAHNDTGRSEWDQHSHKAADFELSKWVQDSGDRLGSKP